ncbi:MAG TPA: S41 family peptidase [Candidatus Limnocylindria bacterium]|nr:S41 family peptidase [Candidatus Limnocylindria bacterium]
MVRTLTALMLAALALAFAPFRAAAAPAPASLSALDVIALEIGYTTVMARYYKPVSPSALLGGARTGIVSYLVGRGIPDPQIPLPPPHADRYSAENEIDRDVALAVARYGSRINTDDLVNMTIAGELAVLHDPYSVLFRKPEYKKFVAFLDGKGVGGIGAELDVDPATHVVRIVDVFPGSPAEGGGLRSGDVITSIEGRPPAVGTPDAVGAQLRGAAGTVVHVGFTRDGAAHDPLALTRRVITPPDVLARTIPGGIGYVRLRSFGADSAKQLDAALARLKAAGVHGYVLDLRGNGGGYRDDAIAVASHFVRGTVVTTQERGAAPSVFAAKSIATIGAPLTVLVDGDTASASEIVAGAIQDEKAGTLIGTRTFGKGLVQETFALPDGGAIKLTTARYLTPAGRDIDRVGITPDLVVAEPSDAQLGRPGHDPQLDRALAVLHGA